MRMMVSVWSFSCECHQKIKICASRRFKKHTNGKYKSLYRHAGISMMCCCLCTETTTLQYECDLRYM